MFSIFQLDFPPNHISYLFPPVQLHVLICHFPSANFPLPFGQFSTFLRPIYHFPMPNLSLPFSAFFNRISLRIIFHICFPVQLHVPMSDPWSDKTPDKGWMDFWKSIHERSLLKNCKASKTWIFFPEAASWMRKPRFRCLNLFLWQFQCIPKGSKELFNFNGCRRKNLVSKELTSLTCWYTFALAGSL